VSKSIGSPIVWSFDQLLNRLHILQDCEERLGRGALQV
jgi:hypothetical protein